MAIRIATASALALAASLWGASAAKAQFFFFDNYQMSPRQIVGVLSDDGYRVRGPMIRRGDVYVIDAISVSGRSVRLIVSSRDGRVLDRYATEAPRRYADNGDDWRAPRPQRDADDEDDRPQPQQQPHDQYAVGDLGGQPSRVYGNDSLFGPRTATPAPAPTASPDSADTQKPKHHAAKKHHDPAVARAPSGESKPSESESPAPSPTPSVAAVQPTAPAKPDEPTKPVATPESVKPIAPTPQAAAPTPSPSQTTAETEKHTAPEAKASAPKTEPSRKKLNDLPVGTLD